MTNRKRVYLPPLMLSALKALRTEPGYQDATLSDLLTVLADRATRAATTPAIAPATEASAPAPAEDALSDICLDF